MSSLKIVRDIKAASKSAALAAFVDSHNTGYYVNSYTTKLNPTMDGVLSKLMDSVRRLNSEWAEEEERKKSASGDLPGNAVTDTAGEQRRQRVGRSMQMLMRFESSFRRASWKSGCEMVFPILFGHLCFATQRCWTVYMCKAIFLAAEAWRCFYGQTSTHSHSSVTSKLDFEMPAGNQILPTGWSQRSELGPNGHSTVYVSPDGAEYDSLSFTQKFLTSASGSAGARSQALRVMGKLLRDYKEGHSLEAEPPAPTGVEAAAAKAGKTVGYALSQLDDWLGTIR